MKAITTRVETALRLEAIASRLEAITTSSDALVTSSDARYSEAMSLGRLQGLYGSVLQVLECCRRQLQRGRWEPQERGA